MATASRIGILLETQTASLKKGFADVTTSVRGLGDRLKRSFDKGRTSYLTFSQAVRDGIAIFRRAVSSIQEFDRLGKVSRQLNLTASELLSLQTVAERFGGSAEGINTLFFDFNKRLGEAALGTGEAKVAFEALGLEVDKLVMLRPSEAFEKVRTRINEVGTETERAALRQKVFGESIKDQNELLGLSSEEMARLTGKYQELTANITTEELEAFNDAWDDLKLQFKVVLAEILPPLLQAFTRMISKIQVASQKIRAFLGASESFLQGRGFNFTEQLNIIKEIDEIEAEMAERATKIRQVKAAKELQVTLAQTKKAVEEGKKVETKLRSVSLNLTGPAAATARSGALSALQRSLRQQTEMVRQQKEANRHLERIAEKEPIKVVENGLT